MCPTLASPWTVARQTPLSMGFSRQEYWSGLPFPSPGDLPDSGIEPRSPASQADSLPIELGGKPFLHLYFTMFHFYNQHEIFCEIKNFSKLTSKLHAEEENYILYCLILLEIKILIYTIINKHTHHHPLPTPSSTGSNRGIVVKNKQI